MSTNVSDTSSSVRLTRPNVDTGAEFKAAAADLVKRQEGSAQGKVQPQNTVKKVDPVVDQEALAEAVERIASYAESLGRALNISVDERSGDFVVRVQNAATDELVRQIPSEEILNISQAIKDQINSMTVAGERAAGGLLIKTKV